MKIKPVVAGASPSLSQEPSLSLPLSSGTNQRRNEDEEGRTDTDIAGARTPPPLERRIFLEHELNSPACYNDSCTGFIPEPAPGHEPMPPTPLRPRSARSARAHDALRRERHTASSNRSPVIFPCDSPTDYAHTSDRSQTMARLSTCQTLPRLWPDNGSTRPRTAPNATTARTHAHAAFWARRGLLPYTSPPKPRLRGLRHPRRRRAPTLRAPPPAPSAAWGIPS